MSFASSILELSVTDSTDLTDLTDLTRCSQVKMGGSPSTIGSQTLGRQSMDCFDQAK
jgi:hypothetical protein